MFPSCPSFSPPSMQELSEDQEDAPPITVSKHHGAVAVLECRFLEWLAVTAMHVDGKPQARHRGEG